VKKQHHLLLLAGVFGLGMGAIPAYKYLHPEAEPEPVFVETQLPTLISAEVIAASVRSEAFLVSSRTYATARVEVRSGTDISSDAPAEGVLSWARRTWKHHTTRDRLTVDVSGAVLAGFDLENISAENVRATDTEVVFDLGTPQFLGVLNDELATKFVSRETGWFRVADKTLYLAAQALGEPKLKTAACKKGALQTAGESGTEIVSRITNLLRAHDDDRTVRVVFTPIRCK